MAPDIDKIDKRILYHLQQDCTISMDVLAERVSLSRNACWRRIKQMEDRGIIRGRVALVDPAAIGLKLLVLVMIRTNDHAPDWLDRFAAAIRTMPEIMGAHRMTGDLDYMLRVRVADVQDYDRFYQRLIAKVPIADISASFVMDDIKETTALPLG